MPEQPEVVCGGILVADHICTPMRALPAAGHLAAVDGMALLTGGCAANVAVDVAKQGISVGVIGRVGDDLWGRFLREMLAEQGVDTHYVLPASGYQTSQTMVLLCEGEDRRFVHTFGANCALRAVDFDLDYLGGARVFYLGGYLVLPGLVPAEMGAVFRRCQERGNITVLDVVVPDGFRYQGELEPILPYTDFFLPNNDEARLLTGCADPVDQIRGLTEMGGRRVIITLGGDGVVFTDGEACYAAPGYPSQVVDQTGAGDAFAAGVIAGIVRQLDLFECVRYGSALGTSCVRALGCSAGVFHGEEAQALLAEQPLPIRRL
ncbi:MAG: carbohydrate kinase family protein [Armatimonadetes bacterium]|nr:carbohydrate kinase family protein [Armatimonadota bacterium]